MVGFGPPFAFFCLGRRFAKADSRPCAFSSALLAAELLSLACARESNQREHTLGAAPSLREGALRAAGFLPTGHPWPAAKAARSIAPPALSRGLSGRPSPRHRGSRGQKLDSGLRRNDGALVGLFLLLTSGSLSVAESPWRKKPAGAPAGSRR